jgi:glycyl-tRNA synthetase
VELTYGMERIAMALQRVRDFRDIRWNADRTYGDVYLQNEQEASKYAFELADVERLREMYDLYEAEAEVCLEKEQVLPAHDYMLKCSHTFNILDTRGAIGVTERAEFFRRMRGLSHEIAKAYVEQRQRLEFPWLEEQEEEQVTRDQEMAATSLTPDAQQPDTLLLEIGTEELPHTDLEAAFSQLETSVPALLDEIRLEHGAVHVYGTPRRLVVHVEEVAAKQSDLEELVKGPPAKIAFDDEGNPTKAAIGFARSKGLTVDDLEAREMDGGRYVAAVVKEQGQPAQDVLKQALPDLLADIHFIKTMRWNETNVAFSRPIRWLLALHGSSVIPFQFAGLTAGASTRGLRFSDPEDMRVDTPDDYFEAMEEQGILLDPDVRQAEIETQIHALAAEVDGEIPDDPDLILEVTHLVEAPTALRGEFNPRHLELPREVLISVMKKHQRYFPVQVRSATSDVPAPDTPHTAPRTLLPYFITVANKPKSPSQDFEEIVRGNEDVIRARFTDAAYFVDEDREKDLEDFLEPLQKLTFQHDLGSMLDKSKRIEGLVGELAPMLNLSMKETETARRAAHLCKADLASQMVVEMTSLQGVMGYYYALHAGEPEAVAAAIREHYLPRSSDGRVPESKAGLTVGIADRLDSLAGLFAAGLIPTGNKDPFALRRAALGLVGNLIAWDLDFDLRTALQTAAENLPIEADPDSQTECLTFIVERLRNLFLDEGYAHDAVAAVVNAQGHNPAKAAEAVEQLSQAVQRPDWEKLLDAYARCVRITRDLDERYEVNPDLFEEEATEDLYAALQEAETADRTPGSVDDFLAAFEPMIPAIDRFFDEVLVMAEDESVRRNRLGLLQRIAALADGVADMSQLEGF